MCTNNAACCYFVVADIVVVVYRRESQANIDINGEYSCCEGCCRDLSLNNYEEELVPPWLRCVGVAIIIGQGSRNNAVRELCIDDINSVSIKGIWTLLI